MLRPCLLNRTNSTLCSVGYCDLWDRGYNDMSLSVYKIMWGVGKASATVAILWCFRNLRPLPPNLYLLNQNQKFMKRTLRLTVMMLLAIIASVNKAYGQEQVHVVNSVAEAKLLNDGDSVCLVVDGAICPDHYEGIIRDETGAIPTDGQNYYWYTNPSYKYGETVMLTGYQYKGFFRGRISMENPYLPKIYNLTYEGEIDKTKIGITDEPIAKRITMAEYWDNVGDAVIIEDTGIKCYFEWNWMFNREQPFEIHSKAWVRGYVWPSENGEELIKIREYYPILCTIHNDTDGLADYEFYKKNPSEWGEGNLQCIGIERHFEANKWYTIYTPISIQGVKREVAKFVSFENGILNFEKINYLNPYTPLLVKFESDVTYYEYETPNPIKADSMTVVKGGDYNFVGTFKQVQPKSGSYYLTEGNVIKPLAPGGIIKPFRCFFEPNTPNVARARAISIDGMTTAIEDVEWGEGNPFLTPIDNRIYTVSGQYVGDDLNALPKGVYLVNGKKIIK